MRKGKTITVFNRRGGVGKTATAHAVGTGLRLQGYKVLLVDLDSQSNLTYDMGVTNNPLGSMEVLTGTATAKEAILKTENGDILPAKANLSAADTVLTELGKEYKLKEALEPLQSEYDYIIIDTPPTLGILSVNALTASDRVIVPVQAEVHSLQGISLLNETISTVQKYTNPNLRISGILITRYDKRTILSQQMKENLEEISKQLTTIVFKEPIRECISIKEAQAVQESIFTYAPKSNAAADYKALLEELKEVL